ncbi:MAG: UvrD-helicase domain-containing protein [Candidatus Desulfofervidaceae bacterium]|nr:UvrD-helicase domain-containing protein [Candidatus Desulfofervidaceae bacterium]
MTQLHIYDPQYHLALEASAGTGKTYTLTLRLLNLLLKQIPDREVASTSLANMLQEVVALTFTNKAAQEMKERLLKWLKNSLYPERQFEDPEMKNLFLLEPDVILLKRKARLLYQLLLENFSVLEISTLDSFLASIVRLFPFEMGVRLDVEIVDETRETAFFNEALDRLLLDITTESELKEAILQTYRLGMLKGSVRNWLNQILSIFVYHQSELSAYECKQKVDIKAEEEKVWQAVNDFINLVKPQVTHKQGQKTIAKLTEARHLREVFAHPFLLKSTLKEHVYFKNLPQSCEEAFQRLKKAISDYLFLFNKWQVSLIFALYKKFTKYYEEIKKRENCITFADLSTLTYRLLVEENFYDQYKSFFYYRLDRRVKHLLLDEFQDTSVIQWRILEPIVNELIAGLSTGDMAGSFFYVGDKKQAIYRFRGGEPALFDYVKTKFPGFIKEETLPINYRSAGGLVSFVNKVGSYLNNRFSFPFSFQEASVEHQGDPYYIEFRLLPLDDGTTTSLGAFVSEAITTLRKAGFAYQDIAILVRQGKTVEKFLPSLKEANIPYQTETEVCLLNAPSIQTLLALLRYLDDPSRKLDGIHFLKGLGFPPHEIERISMTDRPLWEGLDEPYKSKFYAIWQKVDLIPLPSLLQTIYQEWALLNLYEDKENLLQFLQVTYEFEKKFPQSLRSFLNYLRENGNAFTQAKTSLTDAVQVMTVHKAKGLEFKAVILPEMGYDCQQNRDKLIFKYDEATLKLEGVYLKPTKVEAALNPKLHSIAEYAKKRVLTDELNLLYVALTRAKSVLFMGVQPSKKGKSVYLPDVCWARFVLDAIKGEDIKSYLKESFEKSILLYQEGELPKQEIPLKKPSFSAKPVYSFVYLKQPLSSDSEEEIELSRMHPEQVFGEAFHYVMSWIKTLRDNVEMAVNRARERYGFYLSESQFADIKRRVKMVLSNSQLRPYFTPAACILNECPLLLHKDKIKTYRADRVVLYKNQVVVLDYKTQFNPEKVLEYTKQIQGYQSLLSKIFPERKIEGYLIYVLKEKVDVKRVTEY